MYYTALMETLVILIVGFGQIYFIKFLVSRNKILA